MALDELYSYVREKVVAEMPQQRPKKLEDVDGRIVIARNVHWTLPSHLRFALENPMATQRLAAVDGLAYLHRVGNDIVCAAVAEHLTALANDDSRSVSRAASALLQQVHGGAPVRDVIAPPPQPPTSPRDDAAREAEQRAAEEAAAREAEQRAAEEAAAREVEQRSGENIVLALSHRLATTARK